MNDLCDEWREGVYSCESCKTEVFSSAEKIKSTNKFPSFAKPIADNLIGTKADYSLGFERTAVLCSKCQSQLGFRYGDKEPDGTLSIRHSLLSKKLIFTPKKGAAAAATAPAAFVDFGAPLDLSANPFSSPPDFSSNKHSIGFSQAAEGVSVAIPALIPGRASITVNEETKVVYFLYGETVYIQYPGAAPRVFVGEAHLRPTYTCALTGTNTCIGYFRHSLYVQDEYDLWVLPEPPGKARRFKIQDNHLRRHLDFDPFETGPAFNPFINVAAGIETDTPIWAVDSLTGARFTAVKNVVSAYPKKALNFNLDQEGFVEDLRVWSAQRILAVLLRSDPDQLLSRFRVHFYELDGVGAPIPHTRAMYTPDWWIAGIDKAVWAWQNPSNPKMGIFRLGAADLAPTAFHTSPMTKVSTTGPFVKAPLCKIRSVAVESFARLVAIRAPELAKRSPDLDISPSLVPAIQHYLTSDAAFEGAVLSAEERLELAHLAKKEQLTFLPQLAADALKDKSFREVLELLKKANALDFAEARGLCHAQLLLLKGSRMPLSEMRRILNDDAEADAIAEAMISGVLPQATSVTPLARSSLHSALVRLWETRSEGDWTFRLSELESTRVDGFVLYARWPYFQTMVDANMKESATRVLEVRESPEDGWLGWNTWLAILEWAYLGHLSKETLKGLSATTAIHFMRHYRRYMLDGPTFKGLVEICQGLVLRQDINLHNFVSLLGQALELDYEPLETVLRRFMVLNAWSIMSSADCRDQLRGLADTFQRGDLLLELADVLQFQTTQTLLVLDLGSLVKNEAEQKTTGVSNRTFLKAKRRAK